MIIPSKHSGYVHGVRRVFDTGGGGPSSTTQTSDLPDWAKPFAKEQLGAASSLIFNRDASGSITGLQPYQAYGGERNAQFTPLQQQAFQSAGQQGVAGQIGQATGIAGAAAQNALGAGAGFKPYQTGTFGEQAGAYMSPYLQNVVDVQQREASRQAGIASTQRAGDAVKAGAFGGGRQAVVDAEAQRNLATQQGDIQARGLQSAYEQAQQMFNQEQQRGEQSRQYGAGLGLQGAQAALQGAGALGTLGGQQFGQQMDITQQRQALGTTQQQQMQQMMDRQYQDFMAQQRHPFEQMDWLTGQIRGIPMGSQSQVYGAQPSGLQTLAGVGTTLAGFAAAQGGEVTGFAEGGIVQAYAAGGAVEPMALPSKLRTLSDQGLQQFMQQNKEDVYSVALASSEALARKKLRDAAAVPQGGPQGTVLDEVMAETAGGIADAAPDMDFADGGIVGYAEGGTPYSIPGMDRDPRIAALLSGRPETGAEEQLRPLPAFMRALMQGKTVEQVRAEQNAGMPSVQPAAPAPAAGLDAAVKVSEAARRSGARSDAPAPREIVPTPRDKAPVAREVPAAGIGAVAQRAAAPTTTNAPAGTPRINVDELLKGGQGYLDRIREAEGSAAREDLSAFDAAAAKQPQYGESREKAIREEQSGLDAKKGDAKKMALIQAGLAILSADPSRGGLAAIGQGLGQGMATYKGDVEKLEARRGALLDKLDTIEDVRRQEAAAQGKERRALASKERQLEAQALRDGMSLFKEVGIPAQIENVKMTFDAWKSERENATRMAAARMSASSRPDPMAEVRALYEHPELLKTYQAMRDRGTAPKDPMEAYSEWLKQNPALAIDPQKALQNYMASRAALGTAGQLRVTDAPAGVLLSR